MLQLNSKNYEAVNLTIRGYDEPIVMPVSKGKALMDYLTSGTAGNHVEITTEDGTPVVVKVLDIQKVEPIVKLTEVSKYV